MATDIAMDLPATAEPETTEPHPTAPPDHRGDPGDRARDLGRAALPLRPASRVHRQRAGGRPYHVHRAADRGVHRPGSGRGEPAREGGRHAGRAGSRAISRVRLEQAEADLRTAAGRGGLERRRRGGRGAAPGHAGRGGLRAGRYHGGRGDYKQANADYERYRGLAASKIVSAQQLDAAEAARDQAARQSRGHPAASLRRGEPGVGLGGRASRRGCAARRRAVGGGQRPAPAQLCHAARAELGHRGQAERRAGRAGAARPEPDVDRAGHQRLGHGQHEGDPAGEDPRGRSGRVRRGRLSRA